MTRRCCVAPRGLSFQTTFMKNKFTVFASILFVFMTQSASAGLLYTYHQLALKDLDAMTKFVQSKVKESKKSSSGKVVPLKEAYQAVMSRPDDDGLIEKVIGPLRNELEDMDEKERITQDLIQEALNALQNTKNFKADVQVTYWIFLENTIADLKQNLTSAEDVASSFEHRMLQKIAKAKIEITDKAKQERTLRVMKSTISPSEVSAKILQGLEKKDDGKKE